MSIPGLIYVVGYKLLPLWGLQLAFKDFNIFLGKNILDSMAKSRWVGLKYFQKIFASGQFEMLLRNTLTISLLKLVILFSIPIVVALMLNEVRNKPFLRTTQTMVYLPHFLSWVVIHGIFITMLSSSGMINRLLAALNLPPINAYTNPYAFRWLLIFTEGWKETGWSSIVYLAALTGIDPSLYEAARIDGAGRFSQAVHITLPGIMPTIIVLLILKIGNLMNVGYEKIILLYNDLTMETADVISSFVYRKGLLNANYSYSAAIGIFNSIINFGLVIIANALSRTVKQTSLW